ncbi:MAG: phage tail protein [Alphaproteobacteria bacterium]|nr:phage tail protein [Alphaproteobacteria bacterium]
MFKPDINLAALTSHISYMFHCTIGLDPLGDFSAVQGLSYGVEAYSYNELGRNHSPVVLPFEGPGQPGEITLEWGMVVRSKLFDWMQSVKVGGDFRKNVYIIQLSQQRLPLRIYQLTGAWPKSWTASDMVTDRAEWSTEQLVLVYDQIDMFNLSAVAMAGALLGSPVNETIENVRPPGFRPRESGPALRGQSATGSAYDQKTRKVVYREGKPVVEQKQDLERDYEAEAGVVDRDIREAEGLDTQSDGEENLGYSRHYDAQGKEWTYEDFDIDPEAENAEELLAEALKAMEEEVLKELGYSRTEEAEGVEGASEEEREKELEYSREDDAVGTSEVTDEEMEKELDYSRHEGATAAPPKKGGDE